MSGLSPYGEEPASAQGSAVILVRSVWRAREAAHAKRAETLTAGAIERRGRGEAHPVEDFLFTYYNWAPGKLRRWHPGVGVDLLDADERRDWAHYTGVVGDGVSVVRVDAAGLRAQRETTIRLARDVL
ncbi:MAG: hypothetical protein ACRYF3_11835, partial [Janthinobacterium lividum]